MDSETIDASIELFKADLLTLSPVQVTQKHILHGSCLALPGDSYHDLRTEVSDRFSLHPNEILVVGSGKLGFSVAPQKRYRHFGNTSDIDVVIVSQRLFMEAWKAVHKFKDDGGYWEGFSDFRKYLFLGWLRPDKLPPESSLLFAREWWEFFNELSSSGKYSQFKIACALYVDIVYLERYQVHGVSACAEEWKRESQ